MKNSPLCDAITYTRGLEQIYREMWQEWCREKGDKVIKAAAISVEQGNPEKAHECFEMALKIYPQYEVAQRNLEQVQ